MLEWQFSQEEESEPLTPEILHILRVGPKQWDVPAQWVLPTVIVKVVKVLKKHYNAPKKNKFDEKIFLELINVTTFIRNAKVSACYLSLNYAFL